MSGLIFKVHAGDFGGDGRIGGSNLFLRSKLQSEQPKSAVAQFFRGFMGGMAPRYECVPMRELVSVEVASEESVKRVGGTVGWGIAGGALFGPVGLLAGLIAGGRATEVTFVAELSDGRKFLATADTATFRRFQASAFGH